MKKLSLLAAALLGTAVFSVQAGELYAPQQFQDPASTTTRAQVERTVLQERRTGELNHNDVDLPGNGLSTSGTSAFGRTRAAVAAETLVAARTGGLEHNDVDLPAVAKGSVLSRPAVRADAIASRSQKGATAGEF